MSAQPFQVASRAEVETFRGEANPDWPSSAGDLYNLACAESLAGRPEDALEADSDLAAIRDHPSFRRPQA